MPSLIAHYENYLGKIQHGWSLDAVPTLGRFQIVECRGGEIQDVSSFATLGLSNYELLSPLSGKVIRMELLLAVYSDFGSRNIPAILEQIGNEAIERQQAYIRGEVLGPRGLLFAESNFEALYVTHPIYFSDGISEFTNKEGHEVVIAWLVPITRTEAAFARERGWEAFENILECKDPDLLNFNREKIC